MKVFIVEDSATMLNNLMSTLSNYLGVTIIGTAADESSAIEQIDALCPDVVVLDINLLSGSGLSVLKNIKEHHARIKVMMLTNCPEHIYIDRCTHLGADYFFDKTLQYPQFCDALRELAYLEAIGDKSGVYLSEKLPDASLVGSVA